MTQRSKIIQLSSVLLAVCLIASAILLITEGRGDLNSTSISAISVGIILTSALSVINVYLSKIKKKSDELKLNESFFREYEMIRDTVMNSELPKSEKNGIVEDVLEMLLTAQFNGRTIQATVGNTESFAKSILSACTGKPQSLILGFLDGSIGFLLFSLLISLMLWLEDFSKGFFNQNIDISTVVFCVIISFALIPAIRQFSLKKNAWAYLIPFVVGFTYIGTVKLLRSYFYEASGVKTFLDGTVVLIPNIAALTVITVVLMGLFIARFNARHLHLNHNA